MISPCSSLSLEEVLRHARKRGLDGVCITDHDTMEAGRFIQEGIQEDGLCVILGMEYATLSGDFLVFGPLEGLRPGLDAEELLCEVDRQGGVSIAAHPFREGRSVKPHIIEEGWCSIVEGVNGRNRAHENERAFRSYANYGVSFVGGSDAHSLSELGRVTTYIESPVRSRQDFVSSLRWGRFSLASLPFSRGILPSHSSRGTRTDLSRPPFRLTTPG